MSRGSSEALVPLGALAGNSVTTAMMADDQIGTGQLAALTITNAQIANLQVTTAKILDNVIAQGDVAAGALPLNPTFADVSAARAFAGGPYNNAGPEAMIVVANFHFAQAALAAAARTMIATMNVAAAAADSSEGQLVSDVGLAWDYPGGKCIVIVPAGANYQLNDTGQTTGTLLGAGLAAWLEYT